MARVFVGWQYGSGLGHLKRLEPIVTGLLKRGVDVVFATSVQNSAIQTVFDVTSFGGHFSFMHVPRLRPLGGQPKPLTDARTLGDIFVGHGFSNTKWSFAAIDLWYRALDQVKPDLVISDFNPCLNLIARKFAPLIVVGNGFTIPPRDRPLPDILSGADEVSAESGKNEAAITATLNHLARANGLNPITHLADLFRGDENYICTLPDFDPYKKYRNEQLWPPFNVPPVQALSPVNERPRGRVFVYLPSGHTRIDNVLTQLESQGLEVTVYSPGYNAPEAGGQKLSRLTVLKNPADMSRSLESSRLFVHHGGLATTVTCLASGTPQIVLPNTLEHSATAAALKDYDATAAVPAEHERFREYFAEAVRVLTAHPGIPRGCEMNIHKMKGIDFQSAQREILRAIHSRIA